MLKKHKEKRRLWMKVIIIVLFAIALTSFRLIWISTFNDSEQQEITNGELDLRDWDFSDGKSITLAGEWGFHAYTLLEEASVNKREKNTQYIEVPSDWSTALNPDDNSPYGYGSYHLRIYVDADKDTTFSMRIPSVRSTSALYANGLLVGNSGEVGENKEDARAWNVPYSTTSIRADESGVIDIVLQVANFVDPRSSGLVRSVKFGYEEDVKAETELSTILQIVTAVIFFVHALFAGLIYLVGIRDKRLIYFSLAILVLTFINLTGGDEKVFYQYITLDYTTTFKLSMFVMILLSWSLVHTVGPQIETFSKKLLPVYTILFIIASFVIAFLPMNYLASSSNFTFGSVFVGAMITIGALLRSRKSFQGGGIWIALSIVAIASHYIWWASMMGTGLKVVYYPFDLIIAIICLAGVWFRHYHQMHLDTIDQATRLQKADKEKDEFLANTSHELRNPLHSILNMSQSVLEREGSSLQSESVKNLEMVLSVSRRMSFMLNELLEMTSLKDGKPSLQLQPISLQAITAGVVDMLHYMVEGKLVRIVNHIPPDFPSVMGDENRVIQIIFNLLHNAVKYTTDGKITIKATIQDDIAYISIEDTGIGMDEETIRTIFEAYIQGKNGESMMEGGFGLGLNISKKLVELHGGTLHVQSVLGEGSTLTFSLPLADLQAVSGNKTERSVTPITVQPIETSKHDKRLNPRHTERSKPMTDCPRLIVIDDDPVNLEVMETILSMERYEVTTVLTGEDALALLDTQEWDLVISDVMMPQMSGFELTSIIRKRFTMSDLPILLLTARNRQEDIETGFLSGANDYVTKPIDAVELRARVNVLTEVKRSSRERLRMESAWLQAQIQPHFLFNTLNSIMALSEIDTASMQKLLDAFSNVLRGKFNFQNIDEFVPIESELSLIHSYLYIEKQRFGERLKITWEVDEDLQLKIPALTIQPLVENAIEHGIIKRARGGEITIRVIAYETYVEVSVKDDGVGIEDHVLQQILEKEPASQSGVGLLNTNLRLQRLYGKGLQVNSTPDFGTTITFTVPYNKE